MSALGLLKGAAGGALGGRGGLETASSSSGNASVGSFVVGRQGIDPALIVVGLALLVLLYGRR